MVCVPCFIIPLLLFIWHKFVQPIFLRYWNPWAVKDAQGNVINKEPEFPFECKGGVCPFKRDNKQNTTNASGDDADVSQETKPSTSEESNMQVESKKDLVLDLLGLIGYTIYNSWLPKIKCGHYSRYRLRALL